MPISIPPPNLHPLSCNPSAFMQTVAVIRLCLSYVTLWPLSSAVAAVSLMADFSVSLSANNNNNNNNNNKKYVLSNSEEIRSVELGVCKMQLFSFLITWRSSSSKSAACVQNFMKIRWFFTEIWRYIDFQNGGRPPSWNCFTTIRDQPRSLCCWLQLPVKVRVNLIHRSEDIAIWIFRIFGLKCLFRPQNEGFGGLWTPKCDYSSSRPQRHILA